MKKTIYEFIIYVFCFSFVGLFFQALDLPDEIIPLALVLLIVGFGMVFSKHLLKFLTVKVVFLTRLLAVFLIVFGIFYIFYMFLPGFDIDPIVVQEVNWDWVSIKEFEFDKISSIAVLAFVVALLSSLVKLLEES